MRAKLYSIFIIVAGIAVLAAELSHFESRDPVRYVCYLALALAFSRLNIALPGVTGGMSVSFVFVLFGVTEFSLVETLIMGCLGTLVQTVTAQPYRPKVDRILFNVGNMAIAIAVTYSTYSSALLIRERLETPVRLLLAAAVFFAMNTFSVAAVIALSERNSLRLTWRQGYFWAFPYYLAGAALAGAVGFLNQAVGWQSGLLFVPVIYFAHRSYVMYMGRTADGKKHAEEMASLHLRTIEALALAIEAKDHMTHDHLRRVQIYALEVGKELGLDEGALEALRAAALLHDIGKLAVPEHIISKPGKLTRAEFEKIKIHPVVGAEILERVRFPYAVTPIVRSHHEKWNGSGYPDGLKGEEIPLGARILAAVDCLDALASDRQYRRALGLQEAMKKVSAESGISFDPQVVRVLERRCVHLEKLTLEAQAASNVLSTEIRVQRGLEPANGFETPKGVTERQGDFLSSIAAARQEVQTLFELAQDLGNSLSMNETLSLVAIRLKRMIAYDALAIFVSDGAVLRPEYVTGENQRQLSSLQVQVGEGLVGWVAQNRRPILNGDPAVEPGYQNGPASTLQSALTVPLIGTGGAISILSIYHAERDAFTQDNLRILQAIAPKVALAIENAVKYQRAESSAATDYITGLPNARSLFLHLDTELARCRRSPSALAVLVGDLNGFKAVNDRFGHLEGNRLLRVVASSIKESCREYDYVARMGGDEFVFIFPGLTIEQVQAKVLKLNAITKDAGREVFRINTLSLSIGFACFPEDGTDAEQLLAEADRRMFVAKQREKMKVVEPRGYDFDSVTAW